MYCNPIIQQQDIAIFKLLASFKYLDNQLVQKYIYSDRSIKYVTKRVRQLEYHGYIGSVRSARYGVVVNDEIPPTPHKIIYIERKGIETLKTLGIDVNVAYNTHTPHYMLHQLLAADTLTPFLFKSFKNEKITMSITDILNESEGYWEKKPLFIRPDSTLIAEVNGIPVAYFVEIERSYANAKDFKRKVTQQYNVFREYVHEHPKLNEFDITEFRVLFVARNESHANNILKHLKQIDDIHINVLVSYAEAVQLNPYGAHYHSAFRNGITLFQTTK